MASTLMKRVAGLVTPPAAGQPDFIVFLRERGDVARQFQLHLQHVGLASHIYNPSAAAAPGAGRVVIATYHSSTLCLLKQKHLFGREWTMVVLDEAQCARAPVWKNVVDECVSPHTRVLAMSATMMRDGNQSCVASLGRLLSTTNLLRVTEETVLPYKRAVQLVKHQYTTDEEVFRRCLIFAAKPSTRRKNCIWWWPLKKQARRFAMHAKNMLYTSDIGAAERLEIVYALRHHEGVHVSAVSLGSDSLSANVDIGVEITGNGTSSDRFLQRVGRVERIGPNTKGDALFVTFFKSDKCYEQRRQLAGTRHGNAVDEGPAERPRFPVGARANVASLPPGTTLWDDGGAVVAEVVSVVTPDADYQSSVRRLQERALVALDAPSAVAPAVQRIAVAASTSEALGAMRVCRRLVRANCRQVARADETLKKFLRDVIRFLALRTAQPTTRVVLDRAIPDDATGLAASCTTVVWRKLLHAELERGIGRVDRPRRKLNARALKVNRSWMRGTALWARLTQDRRPTTAVVVHCMGHPDLVGALAGGLADESVDAAQRQLLHQWVKWRIVIPGRGGGVKQKWVYNECCKVVLLSALQRLSDRGDDTARNVLVLF
jgi:hypothetical protein